MSRYYTHSGGDPICCNQICLNFFELTGGGDTKTSLSCSLIPACTHDPPCKTFTFNLFIDVCREAPSQPTCPVAKSENRCRHCSLFRVSFTVLSLKNLYSLCKNEVPFGVSVNQQIFIKTNQ